MQGTRVQSLVQKDSTCSRATGLKGHNYRTYSLESVSQNYRICVLQLLKSVGLEPEHHIKE